MRAKTRVTTAAVPALTASFFVAYRRAADRLDMAPAAAPPLPGRVTTIATDWGRLSYRYVEGRHYGPPLVLVHGWGRTADTAWWPLIQRSERPILAVDLPGHGRSILDRRFSFGLAADAVLTAVQHAGVRGAQLVGHSMGGAVALTTLLHARAGLFSSFVGLATSAYWATPRHRVKLLAAPWVLGPRSPFLLRALSRERIADPDGAPRIAWEYASRPARQVLIDAAMELRRFDARHWGALLHLPPSTFAVTIDDGVIDPDDQRASARFFGCRTVDIASDHSVVSLVPDTVARILDQVAARPAGPLLVAI